MSPPLGLSFAPYILRSKSLTQRIKPFAQWYAHLCGYRQMGFKYDDLLIEERDDVQRALTRLTPREQYDRTFRIRRGSHVNVLRSQLPKEQWIKPEEDVRYLRPYVKDVEAEDNERAMWDTITVKKH